MGNLTGTQTMIRDGEDASNGAEAFGAGRKSFLEGTYAIKFYDAFGEDYETAPLAVGAKCPEVVAALEGMANDVVPKHGVSCTMAGYTTSTNRSNGGGSGLQTVAYDLVFEENPGDLKPIEVNAYLDGERPTVYLADGNSTDQEFNVDIDVFPNWKGISGEFVDYFPSICHGVQFQVAKTPQSASARSARPSPTPTNGLTPDEEKLLKACLGDADGNADNNLEVYNWDYGTPNSDEHAPHREISADGRLQERHVRRGHLQPRLVRPGQRQRRRLDTNKFYFSGLPTSDTTKKFAVFPTSGVATVLATNKTAVTARFSSREGATKVYTSYDTSCPELGIGHINHETIMNACLNKGDKVFLFNNRVDTADAGYGDGAGLTDAEVDQSATAGNMYEVVKVGVDAPSATTATTEDRFYFVVDKAINWDGSATAARSTSSSALATVGTNPVEAAWLSKLGDSATVSQHIGLQTIVKFDTSTAESYEYVAQCSGRGLCNEGNCECFAGVHGRQLQPPVRARVLGRARPLPAPRRLSPGASMSNVDAYPRVAVVTTSRRAPGVW